VRAIYDDISLSGPPVEIFGADGEKGAREALLDDLAKLNLLPNLKFLGYGVNDASRCQIPDWIKQPKVFELNKETGEEVPFFGLSHFGAAIGDEEYVKQHIMATIATLYTNITRTSWRMGDVSAHAATSTH
jgi:hypothetical protein